MFWGKLFPAIVAAPAGGNILCIPFCLAEAAIMVEY